MSRIFVMGTLLGAFLLTACDSASSPSNTSPPPAAPSVSWHKDIAPLVRHKCGGCHVEGGIAPFALQTYSEVFGVRQAVRAAVKARIMPPWPPASECAPYQHDRSLTSEQIDLIGRWVDEGALEGNPAEAPASPLPPLGGLSRVDLKLTLPEAYTPRKHPDDYRCFILDWPYSEVRYVTGFLAEPDNRALVHHAIAFLAAPADVARYQALDDQEPGLGYTCFGGPGVDSARAQWVGGWAPGGQGTEAPANTGIRVEPGSKIVLQLHYNTSSAQAAPDRTSLSFKIDSAVDRLAYVMPWARPQWLPDRGNQMRIPAGESDVPHRFTYDPTSVASLITNGLFRNGEPLTVHAAGLHMHTRGARAKAEIWRGGNMSNADCLLDIPRWDFHWQGQYGLAQPKTVRPGDALVVECRFDNSGPTSKDIYWGEGTDDEMCLGTFYITQQ